MLPASLWFLVGFVVGVPCGYVVRFVLGLRDWDAGWWCGFQAGRAPREPARRGVDVVGELAWGMEGSDRPGWN